MKHPHAIRFLATLMIAGLLVTPVMTQSTAEERAAALRQQLAELQVKQTELETRLRQLETDLNPANIEKGLAGVGSTRPEELREQRRRQLDIEKKSVQKQLDQLVTSRTRLETGIAQADAAAYHDSARPNAGGADKETVARQPASAQPASATVSRRSRRRSRKKPPPRRIPRGD